LLAFGDKLNVAEHFQTKSIEIKKRVILITNLFCSRANRRNEAIFKAEEISKNKHSNKKNMQRKLSLRQIFCAL
jgi:hypothetical protein